MSTTADVTVTLDPRPREVIAPAAEIPVAGTLAFTTAGDLLVLERRWSEGCVVVHEYAPTQDGAWEESRALTLKGVRGSPVGCAVSDDGALLAVGQKSARVYDRASGAVVAKLPAVRYQLHCASLGFSPSGARVAVADGGYVSPRNRAVMVCDASTGAKLATIKTGEWSFHRAVMPDESTVLTLGLALDWQYGDDETEGQRARLLRRRDRRRAVAAGAARGPVPHRRPRGGSRLGGERRGPVRHERPVVAVARGRERCATVGFGDGWRAGDAPPVARRHDRRARGEVVPAERRCGGRWSAGPWSRSSRRGELRGGDLPPVVHVGTRRVAATVGDRTSVWQLR
ncbi:MAG: hypothetical protein R3A52_10630 [Polyangiales bacterium]